MTPQVKAIIYHLTRGIWAEADITPFRDSAEKVLVNELPQVWSAWSQYTLGSHVPTAFGKQPASLFQCDVFYKVLTEDEFDCARTDGQTIGEIPANYWSLALEVNGRPPFENVVSTCKVKPCLPFEPPAAPESAERPVREPETPVGESGASALQTSGNCHAPSWGRDPGCDARCFP